MQGDIGSKRWNGVSGVPGLGYHILHTYSDDIYEGWSIDSSPRVKQKLGEVPRISLSGPKVPLTLCDSCQIRQLSLPNSFDSSSEGDSFIESNNISNIISLDVWEKYVLKKPLAEQVLHFTPDAKLSLYQPQPAPVPRHSILSRSNALSPASNRVNNAHQHQQLKRMDNVRKLGLEIEKFNRFTESRWGNQAFSSKDTINEKSDPLISSEVSSIEQYDGSDYSCDNQISDDEGEYSYAYSGMLSQANRIQHDGNYFCSSEWSQDNNIYEPVCHLLGSERDSLYRSISHGRRKILRMHTVEGWDWEEVKEENDCAQKTLVRKINCKSPTSY